MLSVGIIGLPNVGKSTLFNALTSGAAEVSNYPFTTIDPNVGVVAVPDARLEQLAAALSPEKVTPCSIRFIDIAGLVQGASQGEGLGNQFLGEIRQVDAVAHVLRFFSDAQVAHVFAEVDPVRDAEVVETELVLADLEVLERAMAKRDKEWRTHPQQHADERRRFEHYRDTLERGAPLRTLDIGALERKGLKTLGLLSGKPLLFVANVSEEHDSDSDQALREKLIGAVPGAETVSIAAKLEWELLQLEPDERLEFMRELGMAETGLDRLVRRSFELLGLITFYTVVKNKLQAWAIARDTPAQAAAGKVHTDMERGFIRAQVAQAADLLESGSMQELQRGGHVRTVGKEHPIHDGDIVEFMFNV
jgi:GTP-binding protein YchF